jgi:hypothetical protein
MGSVCRRSVRQTLLDHSTKALTHAIRARKLQGATTLCSETAAQVQPPQTIQAARRSMMQATDLLERR